MYSVPLGLQHIAMLTAVLVLLSHLFLGEFQFHCRLHSQAFIVNRILVLCKFLFSTSHLIRILSGDGTQLSNCLYF